MFVQKNAGKAKSLHDVVDDPKLSKEPIKVKPEKRGDSESEEEWKATHIKKEQLDDDEVNDRRQRIKDKLKSKTSEKLAKIKVEVSDSEEDQLLTHEDEQKLQSQKKK